MAKNRSFFASLTAGQPAGRPFFNTHIFFLLPSPHPCLHQGVSVSGRVVQGRVRAGDKVVVMPLEDPATAARLERNGAAARAAKAGDNAEVTLSGVDPSRVVVGSVVCKAEGVLPTVRRFNAQVVALPALEVRGAAAFSFARDDFSRYVPP